jgi:hypothetical protein
VTVVSLIAGCQSLTRLWHSSLQSEGNAMGIIGTIFIGLIVGLLARFLKT